MAGEGGVVRQSRSGVSPWAVLGPVLALVVLGAFGLGEYVVHRMSDSGSSLRVGIRVDGSRISVKVPVCPSEAVEKVEVFDGASDRPLWRADGPRTAEAERGAFTLWGEGQFRRARPARPPGRLPEQLDVSVEYAGSGDGAGDVFVLSRVTGDEVPEGRFWTYGGPMTARDIDGQLNCRGASPSRPPR